jgi:hypothetical protein
MTAVISAAEVEVGQPVREITLGVTGLADSLAAWPIRGLDDPVMLMNQIRAETRFHGTLLSNSGLASMRRRAASSIETVLAVVCPNVAKPIADSPTCTVRGIKA